MSGLHNECLFEKCCGHEDEADTDVRKRVEELADKATACAHRLQHDQDLGQQHPASDDLLVVFEMLSAPVGANTISAICKHHCRLWTNFFHNLRYIFGYANVT